MVETGDDVRRVLEGSTVSLCLDTGHLLVGGTDPAELTRQAPERIAHTHMKARSPTCGPARSTCARCSAVEPAAGADCVRRHIAPLPAGEH